jgi:hypothetical protein
MNAPLIVAGPVLAAALVAGIATPALADGSPSPTPHATHAADLAGIQAAGATATSKRIASLTTAISRVTDAKGISSGDRSTALGTLNADLTAMNSLKTKIAADTTASQARSDLHSVFTEYRVYAVAIPQARIAAAADRLTGTAIPKLQTIASKLAPRVSGDSDLQAKLADLNTQITTATTDSDGLAAAALAVTPSAYNGDHSVMTSLRTKEKAAVAAARQAAQDARAIAQALKK